MKPLNYSLRSAPLAWILCTFFFLAGLAFIPLLGIESDEALIGQGLYQPRSELYWTHIGKTRVPIMLMSYVGALKAWIYGPILRNLGSNLWTLRIPMLLAGTASILLFFGLLRRISGIRAALIGCAILATDAMYLLTATFDWGPVALQHLLLIGGAAALVRFLQEGRGRSLGYAAFLFGLALFDKALAVWMLSGLAVGGLLTFPREIVRAITLRTVAIGTVFFLLGTLPLLVFNWDTKGGTFSGNFQRNTSEIPIKLVVLERTLAQDGLFGWLTADDKLTEHPHAASTVPQRISERVAAIFGQPRRSLLPYALVLALLVAPFAGRRELRILLLAVIATVVAWIQMVINRDTGGSIHHTILLWPMPQLIIAVSLAGASRRLGRAAVPAVAGITAVVALSGALVINEYYVKAWRNGGAAFWTDAILNLSDYFKQNKPPGWVIATDWSIADQIRLLHRGRILIGVGTDQVTKPEMNTEDREVLGRMLEMKEAIWVAHTPEFQIFRGANEKLLDFAALSGFRREPIAVIADNHGRNVYDVYRIVK